MANKSKEIVPGKRKRESSIVSIRVHIPADCIEPAGEEKIIAEIDAGTREEVIAPLADGVDLVEQVPQKLVITHQLFRIQPQKRKLPSGEEQSDGK